MARIRRHISFANVASVMALVFAMGGTGYAISTLPKNSVGTRQLKNNAVISSKVKDRSLKAIDFKAGQLPKGPPGTPGTNGTNGTNGTDGRPGATGAPGTAAAFARVQADGTLENGITPPLSPPQHKGVDATDVQHAGPGVYCFGTLDFPIASAVVSMDNAGAEATTTQVASVAIQRGNNLNAGGCDADHQQARVVITNVDPALAAAAQVDGRFTIWFEK